jgi:hypothetical protein
VVAIEFRPDRLIIRIEGWDRLWALKSQLEVPLAQIAGVRTGRESGRGGWHGWRIPGTQIPGLITAGSYFQRGKRSFWLVRDPDRVIVIELIDEPYDRLVLEVENPAAMVSRIQSAIRA